jgi:hypothetical protein
MTGHQIAIHLNIFSSYPNYGWFEELHNFVGELSHLFRVTSHQNTMCIA